MTNVTVHECGRISLVGKVHDKLYHKGNWQTLIIGRLYLMCLYYYIGKPDDDVLRKIWNACSIGTFKRELEKCFLKKDKPAGP